LPVGALGLFLAGVIATEMSTLDSYCLVAGGNISYDIYKPAYKPDATDLELIKTTRIGIVISWVLGFLMAIAFEQMLGLWVLLASILISSVMAPILIGLYYTSLRKRLAGILSSSFGLLSTLILNIYIMVQGTFDISEETYILHVGELEIMQEYIMYFTVPFSFFGFWLGILIEKRKG
jgi:SSS family solute:Na+ symporter